MRTGIPDAVTNCERGYNMAKYIVKRLLMLIPVLLGVSFIVFFLLRVCAPDPAPVVLGEHATEESMNEWREVNGMIPFPYSILSLSKVHLQVISAIPTIPKHLFLTKS